MRQTARFHGGPNNEAHTREGLVSLLHELDSLAEALSLSRRVGERASSIVAGAAAIRFCRAATRPVFAAAALYVACRECKEPATLRELADASGAEVRDVGRCYATILERLHISRPGLNGRTYVHRLTLKIPLSGLTYRVSEDIIRKATASGLGGRNPMTLAAAALYLASCRNGEKVTQSKVAEAAGVGEESVRECCKAIRALADRGGSELFGILGPDRTTRQHPWSRQS